MRDGSEGRCDASDTIRVRVPRARFPRYPLDYCREQQAAPFRSQDIALRNRSLRAGHGCPPSQCPRYGQIVSAVKAETGGQSLSDPGEFYSWPHQTLPQVVRAGFTFQISAKSEDNLSGEITPEPLNQSANMQRFRTDMVKR